jgi:phosphohistidine phosphatase SixA
VLLIRHARAGDRHAWEGDDRLRPLDDRGVEQAHALVGLLAGNVVTRVLSSPYLRCVQTLEPLARERALAIEEREELAEERQQEDGARLVRALLAEDVVVCCHGGLAEAVAGDRQKKGEVFVLDARARILERHRPR